MQVNLFGEEELSVLRIEEAAKVANVSIATIRNWIKTGYLRQIQKGFVSASSFNDFMSNFVGVEKLTSRANKSFKDFHKSSSNFLDIKSLKDGIIGEDLGSHYENSLSESYRNREGIFYTPSWIVKDMLQDIQIKNDSKFLDPCCGSGNFLIEAIRKGIQPENVYGFDTDENAVQITKKRIKDEFGKDAPNIKVGDFLIESIKLKEIGVYFDFVFTNPPWGKKIDNSTKKEFAKFYDSGNSLDSSAIFLAASLNLLKENGILGFLLQDAFFKISTFEDIRKKILSKELKKVVDYGNVFKGLIAKAQAIILKNKEPEPGSIVECKGNNFNFYRSLESFISNPKRIINFWVNKEESEIIKRLYEVNHITLKDKAKWALGIVTGNNKKYLSSVPQKDFIPIFKGSDITKSGLKNPTNFISQDFSKFQQVAPLDMYKAKEKIIYRFISSDLCFYYDDNQRFILNSANLLIPNNIGISTKQLCDLLNSEIINWLFKKLFATHKVLRGDLELLPIHIDYFKAIENFSEKNYLDYLGIEKVENGTFRIKR